MDSKELQQLVEASMNIVNVGRGKNSRESFILAAVLLHKALKGVSMHDVKTALLAYSKE